jgi:hypothetical protein
MPRFYVTDYTAGIKINRWGSYLAAHALLPEAGNVEAGVVVVHNEEGGGGQLKAVLPNQLLDRPDHT